MIRAGSIEELRSASKEDDWFFIDLGFSSSKDSNGVVPVSGDGERVHELHGPLPYGELLKRLQLVLERARSPLNLVLEAPLSMAFDKDGDPMARSMEKGGKGHRYWYTGPGIPMMTAADRLIRKLREKEEGRREIRLFEGFVPFKKELSGKGDKEAMNERTHQDDAGLLKSYIMDQGIDAASPSKPIIDSNEKGFLEPLPAIGPKDTAIPPIVLVEVPGPDEEDLLTGWVYSH